MASDHAGGGSSGAPVSISALLKKTEHYDKDERYMATSDLCEVLKRQASSSANNTEAAAAGGGATAGRPLMTTHHHHHRLDEGTEKQFLELLPTARRQDLSKHT